MTKKIAKNNVSAKQVIQATNRRITSSSRVTQQTQKQIQIGTKVTAREAAKERAVAAKTLKVAFKDAKQSRDAFGRFLAKLKRDVSGRFVSGRNTQAKPQTSKAPSKRSSKSTPLVSSVIPSQSKQKLKAPSRATSSSKAAFKTPTKVESKDNTLQRDRVYRLRNFPFAEGQTYAEWMNTIEEHKDEIDTQLGPGESFVGTVFGNKTKRLYSNIESLLNKVNEYVTEYQGDRNKIINHIGIITFDGDPSGYQKERSEKIKKTKYESRKVFNAARKLVGETVNESITLGNGKKATIKRKKNTSEILNDLIKRDQERDAEIAAIRKQLESLSKNKPAKKTAKKASKKKGGN
jgi:hypothetical protein